MGMKGKVALSAVVGIVVIGGVSACAGVDGDGSSGGSGKRSSALAERKAGTKKSDKGSDKAEAEKKAAFSGDGDFQVGSDVKPGTYRTTGNDDGMCYWERAKDASGEMDSLLANDNVTGTSYVTVKAGDKLFKSSDCNDWEAVDAKAKGSPVSEMSGDGGMFRVGADIVPGTYKSTGNTDDSCYWERTKDAEHGIDSILANDNANGTAVVRISASDGYFKTAGCKDWKKTG
ncbi:hypothetical protein [Streptomyces griseorubiginosus]|uniref:hypothetical protein n=1 Tax=Streptomyces griseorubiginosus TaxID=67304 RepID=UPI002E800991|nr:hypothetical protein [Streptomyces griseorubiginosus]WUB46527.1 hypothetical protein OHN19_25600 [Streptomyces griseorubiginosus]WUB55048.1 hypothetical protein OG942_25605 [Streptomyces griseorubiginosus]